MNTNNFSLLVKKEWADNRKPLLLGMLVIWGTFVLMGGFLGSLPTGAGTECFIFFFFSGLALSIGASMAFSSMKTKEGRINVLMLPATAFQKYLVRWLATVPLLLIVVVIGIVLGDAARVLVEKMNDFSAVSMHRFFLSFNYGKNHEEIAFLVTMVGAVMLCSQACYFLGAIVWPKHAFIKTLATMQVLQILFGFLLVMCDFNRNTLFIDSLTGLLWSIWIFTLVFCVVVYWLAYVRFCRSQVIYKLF